MRRATGTVVLAALAACLAHAADGPLSVTASAESLDEVLVRGARLSDLREAVIKAEDRMLARYNELNQDHDLDIQCLKFTPTGTRLSYRYCLTTLQKREQQKDAAAFLDYMRNSDVSSGAAQPLLETGIRLMERSTEYRENLIKLLQDHPELREMLKERGDAQRRYEAARREKTNGGAARSE